MVMVIVKTDNTAYQALVLVWLWCGNTHQSPWTWGEVRNKASLLWSNQDLWSVPLLLEDSQLSSYLAQLALWLVLETFKSGFKVNKFKMKVWNFGRVFSRPKSPGN